MRVEAAPAGRLRPAGPARPLDEAVRAIPAAWFRPDPRVYWADLIASAGVGWTAFGLSIAARGWTRDALLIVAAFALYRAALFIHEITHLAPHDVRGFRAAWNALAGVPLLLPSFLYENVHTDHHRQRCYGTPADPEYVPFGRRPRLLVAGYAAASLAVPVLLVLRFAIVAPLAWIVPPLGRLTAARFSALVINPAYIRRAPLDRAARVEEACGCALLWSALALGRAGLLPARLFVSWLIVSAAASAVNAVRTLAAHRYDHDSPGEMTMIEQLLDSCTIAPARGPAGLVGAGWRALWAPVGLRYHALHHWIPSLPYHSLGRAHRRLVATLAAEAPYAATGCAGLLPVIVDLLRRAGARRMPRAPSGAAPPG